MYFSFKDKLLRHNSFIIDKSKSEESSTKLTKVKYNQYFAETNTDKFYNSWLFFGLNMKLTYHLKKVVRILF